MDNYKFGNALCDFREKRGMTQKELAGILDVTDKAVSKWENGQAIPRMNILEKIAEVFETSVEELISIGRENVKRIYFTNDYGFIIHIEINGSVISLTPEESTWIELDKSLNSCDMTVYGEFNIDLSELKSDKTDSIKEKLINKITSKAVDKMASYVMNNSIITKCTYHISDIAENCKMSFSFESFSIGDKMWISNDITFIRPRPSSDGCNLVLNNAVCINKEQVMKSFKKTALTSELGISIPLMLIAYPFRKAYMKRLLKPSGLIKHLLKADYYVEKNEKQAEKDKKTKHPIIKTVGILILFIIAWFGVDMFFDVINVENNRPALVSSDYSTIDFYREKYVRIDELPTDTMQKKELGVIRWYDARIDGLSKLEQSNEDDKVTVYIDSSGNKYLWLVFDYSDAMLLENGDYAEYDDFDEHYVYKQITQE